MVLPETLIFLPIPIGALWAGTATQNNPIVFVPTAEARCKRPEVLPIIRLHLFKIEPIVERDSPHTFFTRSVPIPFLTISFISNSLLLPTRIILALLSFRNILFPSSIHLSSGHDFFQLLDPTCNAI